MSRLRSLLREPLLHFGLAGAGLFALWGATVEDRAEPEAARVVVVDQGVRSELADGFTHRLARPPSEEELEAAIDAWIDREVLTEEAIARGLDQGDPRVRALLASTMRSVLEAQQHVPEPSEAELEAYFDADPARWSRDPRLGFTHVFVEGDDGRARADELAAQLRGGASPAGLGDTFPGGRRYRHRRIDDLAEQFGPEFVDGLDAVPLETWTVRRSRFGFHVVRVDTRSAGADADFAAARDGVRHALMEERRRAAEAAAIAELREGWEIVRAP